MQLNKHQLIIFLAIGLLLAILYYSYSNEKKYTKKLDEVHQEVNGLKEQINQLIEDQNQLIAKNTEKDKIIKDKEQLINENKAMIEELENNVNLSEDEKEEIDAITYDFCSKRQK